MTTTTTKYNDVAISKDTVSVSAGNDSCRRLLDHFKSLNEEKPVEAFTAYWLDKGKWLTTEVTISPANPTGQKAVGFHKIIKTAKKGSVIRRNAIAARSMSSMFSNDKKIIRDAKKEKEAKAEEARLESLTTEEQSAEKQVMIDAQSVRDTLNERVEIFQTVDECLQVLHMTDSAKIAMLGY